jgi:hypothetical protein
MSTPYNTSPKLEQFGFLPAALKTLRADPGVFVQHDRLVELIHCPKPTIVELDYARSRERIDDSPIWISAPKRDVNAPPGFYAQLLRRKDWPGVKPLAGFTDVPLLRPDGTVLGEGGYDAESAFHFEPAGDFTIPSSPTRDDAVHALNLLLHRFQCLPFESEAHRSAFLAALLTPFARSAFAGAAPLFQFDAPRDRLPMLLADYVSVLAKGGDMLLFEKPDSERSFRRQLARTQLRGESLALIRGAETWRSTDPLDTALFSRQWSDGVARTRDPRPITWFAATANGVFTHAAAGLVLPIRLESTEDLATRQSWSPPPEFKAGVARDRPLLVSAALTILRAYVVAGRPAQNLPRWSGFEHWTDLIAGALVWAGASNPLDARASAFNAVTDDTPHLRPLLEALHAAQGTREGVTVHEIITHAEEDDDLRDALKFPLHHHWSSPRHLGCFLRKHNGLKLSGLRLDNLGENRKGYALWSVRPCADYADSLHVDPELLASIEPPKPVAPSLDELPPLPPPPAPRPVPKEKKPIPAHWPIQYHQQRAEEDAAEAAALEAARRAEAALNHPKSESSSQDTEPRSGEVDCASAQSGGVRAGGGTVPQPEFPSRPPPEPTRPMTPSEKDAAALARHLPRSKQPGSH